MNQTTQLRLTVAFLNHEIMLKGFILIIRLTFDASKGLGKSELMILIINTWSTYELRRLFSSLVEINSSSQDTNWV